MSMFTKSLEKEFKANFIEEHPELENAEKIWNDIYAKAMIIMSLELLSKMEEKEKT